MRAWTYACMMLKTLRGYLVVENYNHLLVVTEDIKYDDLPKEVLPEIKLIEHLVRDYTVFTSLKDCVLSGQIRVK